MENRTQEDAEFAKTMPTRTASRHGEGVDLSQFSGAMGDFANEQEFQAQFLSGSADIAAVDNVVFSGALAAATCDVASQEEAKARLRDKLLELPRQKLVQMASNSRMIFGMIGEESFTFDELAVIGRYQKEVAERLDFSKLTGTQTFWIAKMQPELKDRCDLSKLSDFERTQLEYQK